MERERQSRRQAVAAAEALQAKLSQQGDALGKQARCQSADALELDSAYVQSSQQMYALLASHKMVAKQLAISISACANFV